MTTEAELHTWAIWLEIFLAGVTCLALLFVTAPYGRFTRAGWGPRLSARWGWVLMETPALLTLSWPKPFAAPGQLVPPGPSSDAW